MDKLKKLAYIGLTIIALTAIGAFGLSFIMPDVDYKTLLALSFGLLVVLYFIYQLTSVILKIALIVIIISAVIMFLL